MSRLLRLISPIDGSDTEIIEPAREPNDKENDTPQMKNVPDKGDHRLSQKMAESVARRTEELLATKGWCLWRCQSLDDEIIAIVRDEDLAGVPEKYVVYSLAEIRKLFGRKPVSQATLRLIHEAKRTGARVVGWEPVNSHHEQLKRDNATKKAKG